MKRIVATFYRTPAGVEPVRDWLLDMEAVDRRIVGSDIAAVEFGWPIGMPVCKPLKKGLYEVRSTIRSGKVEARVYFAIEDDAMILLHGQVGKGGQNETIDLARERLRSCRKRMKEGGR